MSKNHPLPMQGSEYDAFTGWKHLLCYLERPGVSKKIKRAYNKRVRKHYRQELRNARDA